jgi:predicted nucleic acid-binding Zn finger protein
VGAPSRRAAAAVASASSAGAARHAVLGSHCDCESFYYDVIARGEAGACKHVLAARVARAVGGDSVETVPDEVLARLLIAG